MQHHFDPVNKFIYTTNQNGQYHSHNDKPAIEYIEGRSNKIWMTDGKMDRDYNKGPALMSVMGQHYYKNGVLHNPIGHAHHRVSKVEYYYNGIEYKPYNSIIRIGYDDYDKIVECGYHRPDHVIHGVQQAFINEKWVDEIWIDDKKIAYNSLPMIVEQKNELYVFGYNVLTKYPISKIDHTVRKRNRDNIKNHYLKMYSCPQSPLNMIFISIQVVNDGKKTYYLGDQQISSDNLHDKINNKEDIGFLY